MYAGVPRKAPVRVTRLPAMRAMPKSLTFAVPPAVTRMLLGLTSRWITPRACA
jgi:hypothetical protein